MFEWYCQDHARFNPTLVRLRRSGIWPSSWEWTPFQSHAGSIEASASAFAHTPPTPVSIPRWFD